MQLAYLQCEVLGDHEFNLKLLRLNVATPIIQSVKYWITICQLLYDNIIVLPLFYSPPEENWKKKDSTY